MTDAQYERLRRRQREEDRFLVGCLIGLLMGGLVMSVFLS